MRTELQIKANKKMIIIGIIALGTALLTAVIKVELDVTPRIIIVFLIAIVGIPCCAIGLFYRIRINDNGIEEKCLFYKKRVELNESVRISETIHYSNYEVGSRYVYIANNICIVTLRPWLVDTPSIAKKLNEMGLLIVKYNPKVECGSSCKLPDVEIEALSYRLITGKRNMKKVSLSILVLVALALTLDFKISSWILLIASSYWYFFLFMHHDLFFARGDLIIGNEGRYSNIWRKLDIKVDSKLLLLFAAATVLLWAALFYCYSRTEVLSDSNPYLYSLCLIVAFGLIRMCAIEERLIVWILLTLVASASLVIYSFYIEWNIAKYYNITVAHSTIVNEKRVNTILFEGNEYNIYSSSSSIDGDDIEFVVHRSIFGNVYAREN